MAASALIDDMGVDNVAFLIENLGADASELQYLRELVQNSFESIERSGRREGGRVKIDYKLVNGVRKLRITDNGAGMTPEEVCQNINHLSASGGTQSFDKNFGIGAKITAATRNPAGVQYESWKDGEGSLTVLGKLEGRYGRLGFLDQDSGAVDYHLPLPADEKPETIDRDGVSVVLLGQSPDDDTTKAPAGADLPSQWVSAYLERRYFSVPEGVLLTVEDLRMINDAKRGERPSNDTIRGQRLNLDNHSDFSGCVLLPAVSARVWWWILKEETLKGGKNWNNRGHVAALYQNELYEIRTKNAGRAALKDFGIYAGHSRIVVYAEPTSVLKANTARTLLILPGNVPVDYAEIGAAFAGAMPAELAAFMAGQVKTDRGDHQKDIRRNLQELEAMLRETRYQQTETGKVREYLPEVGVSGDDPPAPGGGGYRPNGSGDASGRLDTEFLRRAREEKGRRLAADPTDKDQMPTVVWSDDTHTVQEGRAASYVHNVHVVTISTAFPFFRDVLGWAEEEGRKRAQPGMDETAVRAICEDEVKRWYAQALVEAIVSLRPMAHHRHWGPKVYETGLSDEGLTAAVMSQRWHMMKAIRAGLGMTIGSPRD